MRTKFLYFVMLFAIANSLLSQNCNLNFRGKVIDFHDNTPIIGASLYIKNLNIYTTSNLKGEFEFKDLCNGKLNVIIKHISCKDKEVTINLTSDVFKQINMEHHEEQLNEVIVKASTKSEITGIEKQLQKGIIENFSDKSLGDALSTISGVNSLNTGNSIVKPMIHGLHSSRLLIVNNNVRLFDQEWGDEHAPNIDINSSSRIAVVKGANTLKYGSDAIGGLILIKPKRYFNLDTIFGSTITSFNTNGLGGSVNTELVKTNKKGFYTKFQANYKRFGDFEAPNYSLTNSGVESINTSFNFGVNEYEKGYNVFYSYVNNEFGILQSSHIGNVNDLVNAINSDRPRIIEDFSYDINNPRQAITHHMGKIDGYKRIKGLGKLSAQLDVQLNTRREFDLRRGDFRDRPAINLQLFTTSFLSDLEIDFNEKFKTNSGIMIRYQNNNSLPGTGVRPLIPDFNRIELGTYFISNYELSNNSKFSAGIRYDFANIDATKTYNRTDWDEIYGYNILFPEFETSRVNTRVNTNPNFTFHNISGSLGFSKIWDNKINLLINYGLASRIPNPSELFSDGLHHSAARIEIGQLTINKEIAHKFAVSLERNNDNFGFSINPYAKIINGFVQLIPIGITTTIRGAFPVWEYNQVDARIYGLDFDINKKIASNLNYVGSLSLLRGDNTQENIPLINMPATNFRNRISYVNKKANDLTISLHQQTVFQQNRFPDYNFFTFNPITQEDVFVDISSTPPTYSLFGLQTSAVFDVFKKGSLKVEFNIENLFDVAYREHLNRFRFFADELGRNFNIKIKINY